MGKVLFGIAINDGHELDIDLIRKSEPTGFLPDDVDEAMLAWENRPLEENLKIIKKVSAHFAPQIRQIAAEFTQEVNTRKQKTPPQ